MKKTVYDIKTIISEQLRHIPDGGFALALRQILFNNDIDWEQTWNYMQDAMPELKENTE